MSLRVLLVDDHPLFRRGVKEALEQGGVGVVGEATNGKEAVELAQELKPDVVLMDLLMPVLGGLEATAVLHKEMPQLGILILTVSEKEKDLAQALKFGARGYILKNASPQELLEAVQKVARGEVCISPVMAAKLLTEFPGEEQPSLTEREREVLGLVAKGATNKQIAEKLFIAENTVKVHLRNILDKLHLKNRAEAAAYAVRTGLVPPEG